jgi:uncharacterized protein YbbC (DUF1343 family)
VLLLFWVLISGHINANQNQAEIKLAAERPSLYLPLLKEKRVGVVVNQSSRAFDKHLLDYLLEQDVQVTAIFSPEHGFRGDKGAGEKVSSDIDPSTQLPIYSLYGKTRKPTEQMLENVDILLFDIQDVGVRFYTYISTLHYVMEAASELGKSVIVLDKPNPNIMHVDGPILEPEYRSFVGMHPIPVLHGMTVAEIALMIKGEAWIENAKSLQLNVIPVANYDRQTQYSLPIKPSPNLPNDQAIQLYASLCFFEPTRVSVGRGTEFPFQLIGHNEVPLGNLRIVPRSMPSSAPNPKLKDQSIFAQDLRQSTIKGLDLTLLFSVYNSFDKAEVSFFTSPSFFDKLAGTAKLREALEQGSKLDQVVKSWQPALARFKQRREPYLLYPEQDAL